MPCPLPEAPNEDHLEFIHYQLDLITEASGVVLYGLIMLGERLQGGVLSLLYEQYNRISLVSCVAWHA